MLVAYVTAIMSIAVALWLDVLGKTFGVNLWTVLFQFLSSLGTLVALSVLAYNIWKDRKAEALKFEQIHSYVYAFCDELIATLTPLTKDRSPLARPYILRIPALVDVALAEKLLWEQYRYFLYPTDFNFRYLLFSLRTLLKEHSAISGEISGKPKSEPVSESSRMELLKGINNLLIELVERVIVSAEITLILDVKVQRNVSTHMLTAHDLKFIEMKTNIGDAQIRKISRELRCKIENS
jgi:hypothetical protein